MPTARKAPTKSAAPARITAWSFSRYYGWRECPLKYKLKHIDKLPEGPEGPALVNGKLVHKLAENYALGLSPAAVPVELETFTDEFKELRAHKKQLAVEQQWGFDNKWQPTDWFGKQTWVRVVADAVWWKGAEADVIDHKTGKAYPYHEEQLSLTAIATFAQSPTIKVVNTKLWYLDPGTEVVKTYKLSDVPALKKFWEKATKPMFAEVAFKPKPNASCRWCHYRKANNGPCPY